MPGLPQQVTGSCTFPQDSERAGWEWFLAFVCLRESDISNLAQLFVTVKKRTFKNVQDQPAVSPGASLLSFWPPSSFFRKIRPNF